MRGSVEATFTSSVPTSFTRLVTGVCHDRCRPGRACLTPPERDVQRKFNPVTDPNDPNPSDETPDPVDTSANSTESESRDELPSGQPPSDQPPNPEQRTAAWAENRRRAVEIVPEIGDGRRWYDLPYKFTIWLLQGRTRKLMPRWMRLRLNYLQISLHAFNTRDQLMVWNEDDLERRLGVPEDEHVSLPALWIVELFPPSRYEALLKASKRKGWNRTRGLMQREKNDEILEASRGGRGWVWWNLAEITDPRSPFSFGGDTVEKLPAQFVAVELRGITVGPSLTAVVGCFTLDKGAEKALDDVWHADHEPSVIRRGPTLQAEDRQWSGFRHTQQKRQTIHDTARTWMSENIPGFFATSDEPQPILDLCLTDAYDPTAVHRERDEREIFRALGLIGFETEHRVSDQVPGFLLIPADGGLCANLEARNLWTLWGQRQVVKEAFGDSLSGRGTDLGRAVASALDHRIRMFAVALAFTGYVNTAKAQHAVMRDNATGHHRRFSTTQLRTLRRTLLNLSLDLAGMERDTRAFWARKSYWDPIVQFRHIEAPGQAEWLRENNLQVRDPIDFNKRIRKRQQSDLRALVEADDTYRDIVSTVSALGASADSTRVGRLALIVAAASFVVAGVTLWVTLDDDNQNQDPNQPTIGQHK